MRGVLTTEKVPVSMQQDTVGHHNTRLEAKGNCACPCPWELNIPGAQGCAEWGEYTVNQEVHMLRVRWQGEKDRGSPGRVSQKVMLSRPQVSKRMTHLRTSCVCMLSHSVLPGSL